MKSTEIRLFFSHKSGIVPSSHVNMNLFPAHEEVSTTALLGPSTTPKMILRFKNFPPTGDKLMMSKGKANLLLAAVALVCCTAIMNVTAMAQDHAHPTVVESTHAYFPGQKNLLTPDKASGKNLVFDLESIPRQAGNSPLIDQALQTEKGPLVSTVDGLNFEGIPHNCGEPSDSNGAVGLNQYVEWINCQYAVYDKATGAVVQAAKNGNTLFTSLGGQCANNNSGDPIAQYDKLANRWVLTQPAFTAPYFQCIAVSTTSD